MCAYNIHIIEKYIICQESSIKKKMLCPVVSASQQMLAFNISAITNGCLPYTNTNGYGQPAKSHSDNHFTQFRIHD